jgi:hypothetical protein
MSKISLFKVGLVAMLFFVLSSNVLNYVSIATNVWAEDVQPTSLWLPCNYPVNSQNNLRNPCFNANPPALIATGTAFNCLAFLLIVISQLALCMPRFKDSFALYFVIGSLIATLFSLVFSSIGWFFVFFPQYQNLSRQTNYNAFNLGWSFWLMTPSFGCSIVAAIIGASIFGCTCVTNKVAREVKTKHDVQQIRHTTYITNGVENPNFGEKQIYFSNDSSDPQVLRL